MRRLALLAVLAVTVVACGGSSVLQEAHDLCALFGSMPGIRLADEGASILIDGKGEEAGSGLAEIEDIACILNSLEAPDSVISRIDSTSALQGQQEANWGDVHAFWTYHPNNGLDVIIELAET